MMIGIYAFGSQDGSMWNELVAQSPHASFYHLWEWGEVLSTTYGYRRYYLVAKQDGDLVGAFPLIYVKSLLFGNRLISLPFCEYGGPITHPKLDNNTMREVTQKLVQASNRLAISLGVKCVDIRGLSNGVVSHIFESSGYTYFQRYVTFRVDLVEPVEALWRNLDKKARNATRKALESRLKVIEARETEQVKTYYSLYLKVQKRLGSPPHAYALFKNIFETFYPKGMMKTMLAEHQGKPIAGIVVFKWRNVIYWTSNVTDMEHRHLNPTNLLLWTTIESGSKNHNKALDLGRTRRNTTIHHFKKGWGGKEVRLNDYARFFGKVRVPPDPNQGRYVYLSKLWSLIPMAPSRCFGPYIISRIAL